MKIYERTYDEPLTVYWKKKPNKFLWEFKIVEGEELKDEYRYTMYWVKDNLLYIIEGVEIIFSEDSWTETSITPIEDSIDVKMYNKYNNL